MLMAYASGQTLRSTARRLGISLEAAKTYIKRVKSKYERHRDFDTRAGTLDVAIPKLSCGRARVPRAGW